MGAQSITLVGNLTGPPELRVGPSGKPFVSLTVACQDRYRDANGQFQDGDTLFQRAVCFGPMAENIAASFNRGDRVVLTGALRQSSYEHTDDKGETSTRWSTDFVVDEAAASVRWCEVKVKRAERRREAEWPGQQDAGDDPWAAPPAEPALAAAG